MLHPIEVEAREPYRIWLRFSDGVSGEIDLSDVAGMGVFQAWDEPGFFEKVHLDEYGAVAWNEQIDLCSESLYLELTGKSWEVLPGWIEVEEGETAAPAHS